MFLDIILYYYVFFFWWIIIEIKGKSWNEYYKEKVYRGVNFGKCNVDV